MTPEILLRSTLLLSAGVIILLLLQRLLPIRSAKVQRTAWFAVILLGVLYGEVSWNIPWNRSSPAEPVIVSWEPHPIRAAHEVSGIVVPQEPIGIDKEPREAELAEPFTLINEVEASPNTFESQGEPQAASPPHPNPLPRKIGGEGTGVMEELRRNIGMIWIGGVVFFLLRWGIGYGRFLRRVRSFDTPPENWRTQWESLLVEYRVRGKVPLYVSRDIGPALVRLPFQYALVVPRDAWDSLGEAGRRTVMKHELAHYLRRDIPVSLFTSLIVLAHWFNPLAWLALARFEAAAELQCDDFAHGRREADLADYCDALLLLQRFKTSSAAGHAVNRRRLSQRIARLVHYDTLPLGDSLMKKSILILLFATLFFCGAVRIQLVAQEEKTEGTILAMPKELPSPSKEEMRLQGEEKDFVLKNNIGQSLINDVVKPDPDYLELQKKRLEIAQKNLERAKQQRAENKISDEQLDQAELLLAEADYAYKAAASPRSPDGDPRNRGIHHDDVNPDYIKLLKFRLQIAQKNMERAQKLFEAKVVSDLERDDVRLKLMEAAYALKKAEQLYELRQLNNGPLTAEAAPTPTETKIDPEELQLLKLKVDHAKKVAEITQHAYEIGAKGGTSWDYWFTQAALAGAEANLYRSARDRANHIDALARKTDAAKKLVDATTNGFNAGAVQVTALLEAQQTLAEAEFELKKAKDEKDDARPKRLTPPQTEERSDATVPEREKFLYDNRTFWEWKKQAETELNPDRHIDIVKAFGAFARKGFGKEAIEAILKMCEDYPTVDVSRSSNPPDFGTTVMTAFKNDIPVTDSIPILLERCQNPKDQSNRAAFDIMLVLVLKLPEDASDEDVARFKPFIAILLKRFQNDPVMIEKTLPFSFIGMRNALIAFSNHDKEIPDVMEKTAFGKGSFHQRQFAFDILMRSGSLGYYDRGEFQKYLPRLVDLLLGDDKADQEFAGKIVRLYAFGMGYQTYTWEDNLYVASPPVDAAEFYNSVLSEQDRTLETDQDLLRQIVQAMMYLDESGVQTAKFLKGVYAKTPENVREIFADQLLFAMGRQERQGEAGPSRPSRTRGPAMQSTRQVFLLELYFNTGTGMNLALTPRGENLRKQLEDSPELLKLFDEQVAKIRNRGGDTLRR